MLHRAATDEPDINKKIMPFAKAYNLNPNEFEMRNGRIVYKEYIYGLLDVALRVL